MNDALPGDIANAINTRGLLPSFPSDLSLADGYEIQAAVVELVSNSAKAGIKAGITTPAMQAQFGVDHPLLACLYAQGALEPGAVIDSALRLNIECEIGVLIDSDGTPLAAGPAIELVGLRFASPGDVSAANLAAANVGAYQFIRGEQQSWRKSFADVRVSLTRDGEVVNEASMMEAMGGPHAAVPWIFEEAQRRQIPLDDQTYVMTGTCGSVVAGEAGHYIADYGDFGRIEFTVT